MTYRYSFIFVIRIDDLSELSRRLLHGWKERAERMNANAQVIQTSQLPSEVKGILDRVEPSHIAIISPDGPVLTYRDLKHQVNFLSKQLHSFGIGRRDRVTIVLPNGVGHIVSFLAVTAAGATAAPLNPAFTNEELRFCLEDANAKAFISSPAESEAVKAAF